MMDYYDDAKKRLQHSAIPHALQQEARRAAAGGARMRSIGIAETRVRAVKDLIVFANTCSIGCAMSRFSRLCLWLTVR